MDALGGAGDVAELAEGFDARGISRKVVAEMSAAWREPWLAALELQRANPAIRRIAERSPEDFGAAADRMVAFFAFLHPSILRTAAAHCDAVAAEFGFLDDVPVTPLREHTFVAPGDQWGGQQQDVRLAQLEVEMEAARADIAQLRRLLRALGAVLDDDTLRSSREASTALS